MGPKTPPAPPAPDYAAAAEIERLERERAWPVLRRLADLYRHRARLAADYAHVLECAERLRLARESYDRALASPDADLVDDLGELVVFDGYSGDSVQLLHDTAGTYSRLASAAAEAAKSKDRGFAISGHPA